VRINVSLDTQLVTLPAALRIKAGSQAAIQIGFLRDSATVTLDEGAQIEIAFKAKNGGGIVVFGDGFAVASGPAYEAIVDFNDTRLLGMLADRTQLELVGEILWVIGYRRYRAANFALIAEAPLITGPAASETGPVWLKESETNARYAAKSANLGDLANPAAAKTNIGLGNVNNTADADKPVSTATAAALATKIDLTSEQTISGTKHFSGGVEVPTQPSGTNNLRAASTAFVQAAINALVAGAPGALNTLNELATALGDDANFAATVMQAIANADAKRIAVADHTARFALTAAEAKVGDAVVVGTGWDATDSFFLVFDTSQLSSVEGYKFLGLRDQVPVPNWNFWLETPSPFLLGSRITCNPGTWSNDPIRFTYQWMADNGGDYNFQPIAGATGSVYFVSYDLPVGTHIYCSVIAWNDVGPSGPQDVWGCTVEGDADLHTELFGYWKLSETSGTRADSAGNGLTLTAMNGCTGSAGKLGNAADFPDGSKYLMRSGFSDYAVEQYTVSAWVKATNASPAGYQTIVSCWNGIVPAWFFLGMGTGTTANKVAFSYYPPADWMHGLWAPTALSLNAWHHVAAVVRQDTVELWIDGVKVAEESYAGPVRLQAYEPLEIGRDVNQSAPHFRGQIDEVAVWRRPLRNSEIVALYNSGNGLTYPLV
jgi:hypothetical protein